MSTSLRNRLGDLAATFATRIVDAIRSSSLEEMHALIFGAAHEAKAAGKPRAPAASHRSKTAKPRKAPLSSVTAGKRAARQAPKESAPQTVPSRGLEEDAGAGGSEMPAPTGDAAPAGES